MARLADPELAERRRRQIMDAAIACFRRRGFHQATMAEICAEAGISAGALYRYFSSKTDIIGAIAEDKRGESDEAFMRAAEQHGFVPAVCLAARAFFEKFADGDGALIAEIMAEAIRDDTVSTPLRASDASSVEIFTRAIIAAQKRGEVDATLDPKIATNTLFATLEGIGLRRAFCREIDADAALLQFRALVERYLEPRK
ncbi:MAG: TetR/AcrR family transcriptional regulator [Hyphomonadaceae bacterium]|nr:TetR/AcrR family transcriptional regulator [Hyphomonadaceae bacterium]